MRVSQAFRRTNLVYSENGVFWGHPRKTLNILIAFYNSRKSEFFLNNILHSSKTAWKFVPEIMVLPEFWREKKWGPFLTQPFKLRRNHIHLPSWETLDLFFQKATIKAYPRKLVDNSSETEAIAVSKDQKIPATGYLKSGTSWLLLCGSSYPHHDFYHFMNRAFTNATFRLSCSSLKVKF